jgi:hypothetical protein
MEKRKMKPATIPKMATSLAEEKYKEEKEKKERFHITGGFPEKRGRKSPVSSSCYSFFGVKFLVISRDEAPWVKRGME